MSKAVGKRAQILEIRKLLNQKKYDIHIESDLLVDEAAAAASLEKAKQYYGSSRIQGIVRGFLARVLCKTLVIEYRASLVIQKVMRGKLVSTVLVVVCGVAVYKLLIHVYHRDPMVLSVISFTPTNVSPLLISTHLNSQGRMKWMMEYWESISVVKSPEALDALIERSTPHRDSKESKGPSWREYYDPVSGMYPHLHLYLHMLIVHILR